MTETTRSDMSGQGSPQPASPRVAGDAVDASRFRPEQALRPGRADAGALLAVWYVRKSVYWLLFTGVTIAYLTQRSDEIEVDWGDPDAVLAELLSPLAGIVLAVLIRIVTAWLALALCYPLLRVHEELLEPRTGFGSGIGAWLDRRNIAKAYRSLRWTHHVRLLAHRRLGPTWRWVRRLDPIIDALNITSFVVMVVALVATAPSS